MLACLLLPETASPSSSEWCDHGHLTLLGILAFLRVIYGAGPTALTDRGTDSNRRVRNLAGSSLSGLFVANLSFS
jgi:hypothetical protein